MPQCLTHPIGGCLALTGVPITDLQALEPSWHDLPPDQYLKDGGRYRRRRHASFEVTGDLAQATPHRAHWQPLSYNALHGGMQRWFEPMSPEVVQQAAWHEIVVLAGPCGLSRAGRSDLVH
jgi:hypothetical protein